MHPLLIWLTHFPKIKGDSWALGRLLASLIALLAVVCLVIWQYGSSDDSAQPQSSARAGGLAACLDCLTLLAVSESVCLYGEEPPVCTPISQTWDNGYSRKPQVLYDITLMLDSRMPSSDIQDFTLELKPTNTSKQAGAIAIIMVTILHAFFKFPFLPPCVESPRSLTSGKTISEKDTDSPPVDIQTMVHDDEELFFSGGDTVDIGSFPCTQFLDLATATDDPADPNSATDDNTLVPEGALHEIVKSWASVETSRRPGDSHRMFSTSGHMTGATAGIDLPGAGEPGHTSLTCQKDAATQTDRLPKPDTASVGTMTPSPQRADASVGCQNTYKLVKTSNTTTSGPFMKKLRRAQRLLKEARIKLRNERHSKLVTWTEVLGRYKTRLQFLTQSLEKKDVLLSYTALNKALSENEIKDMCTAVSSARDRLLTQCKLNSALKEVVVSKCDSVTSAASSQTPATQN